MRVLASAQQAGVVGGHGSQGVPVGAPLIVYHHVPLVVWAPVTAMPQVPAVTS